MIVVASEDFELYHGLVGALRDRSVAFTTIAPGEPLPETATVVIQSPEDPTPEAGVERIEARPDNVRRAVDEALALVRDGDGRTVVGVDPGDRPGLAVLVGETVVAAFQVPLAGAAETIRGEIAEAPDPLVRIGDGARLAGSRIADDLPDMPVELVDETGTTPHLGTGAAGAGDLLAAVNIARLQGERIEDREIEPTAGELQRIKDESRRRSGGERTIDEALARRVAAGELNLEEALSEHRHRE